MNYKPNFSAVFTTIAHSQRFFCNSQPSSYGSWILPWNKSALA